MENLIKKVLNKLVEGRDYLDVKNEFESVINFAQAYNLT